MKQYKDIKMVNVPMDGGRNQFNNYEEKLK